MPTSPKASGISLFAETEEEQQGVERYKQTQRELREALENRQNQLFDPVLLAMAQGFFSPTKAGGFGESLANVAAAVGPVQEREQKRQMEMAQIRAELAAQELGQMQATRRERGAQGIMRGLVEGAPAGVPTGQAGVVARAGTTPTATTSEAVAEGQESTRTTAPAPKVPSTTGGLRPIMESDIAAMSEYDPKRAEMLDKIMKSQRDRLVVTQGGAVFDRVLGDFTGQRVPSQEQKEYRTPFGRVFMLPWQHDIFVDAAQRGLGREWMENFKATGVASPASTMKPSAGTPGAAAEPGRMRTVEEERAEEAAQKVLAEERAKGIAKRTEEAINAGQNFTSRMATYNSLDRVASRPDADKVFGILNRPGVAEAITRLASDTVRAGAGNTISVPGLESALRNVGLPQELINQYQFALSQMANLQLQQSRITEGQGAVSDRERELFAVAAITDRDNPATIRAKLDMYRIKARFDRELSNELIKSGLTLDQFKIQRRDWLEPREQKYLEQVESVVDRLGLPAPKRGTRATPSQQPSGAASDSAADIRRRLNLPLPPGAQQ